MKKTQKIFLAICMVALSLGRIFAFDENAVIINDSGNFNAISGIDTSKEIITDTIQGRLGDNSGQSVCETLPKTEIYPEIDANNNSFERIGDFFFGFDLYSAKQVENLFKIRIDYMEIKRKANESVCVYVISTDKSFMKTKLSSEELERFKKFVVEYDIYDNYRGEKYYLNVLKFFKHYGKIEAFYDNNALASSIFMTFLKLEGEFESATESGIDYAPIAMYEFVDKEVLAEPPYSKFKFDYGEYIYLNGHRVSWRDLPHKLTQKNVQNCRYPHLPNCKRYERELRTIINFVKDKLSNELWY